VVEPTVANRSQLPGDREWDLGMGRADVADDAGWDGHGRDGDVQDGRDARLFP